MNREPFSPMQRFSGVVKLRLLFCVFSLAVPLMFFGCSIPTELEAPRWDVGLTLPVSDYTYYFSSILDNADKFKDDKDQSIISAPGDSIIILEYSLEPDDSYDIKQELKIDPLMKESYHQEIGRIYVEMPDREEVYFPFHDVFSEAELQAVEGMIVPVPSITFEDTSSVSVGAELGFRRMLFAPESITDDLNNIKFKLRNSMPVEIISLVLSIHSMNQYRDFATGQLRPAGSFIAGSSLSDIPMEMAPGEYVEMDISLAGKTFPSDIFFKLSGYTRERGSAEEETMTFMVPIGIDPITGEVIYEEITVTIPVETEDGVEITPEVLDSPIEIVMEFSRMEVEKVEARIPEQRTVQGDEFDLTNPEMTIVSAHIDSGGLNFKFTNHLPVEATINLSLPGFGITRSVNIPKRVGGVAASGEELIDFAGITLNFTDPDEQIIAYEVEIITSEEASAVMTNQDFIDIEVSSKPFIIGELTGYLGARQEIPEMTQALPLGDFPDGFDGALVFKSVILKTGFYLDLGGSDIPNRANLTITGLKNDGRRSTVSIDTTLTTTGFYEFEVEAAELLSLMPDSLKISGYIAMQKGELATFSADSDFQIGGSVDNFMVELHMPLVFRTNETKIKPSDISKIELSKSVRDAFLDGDVKSILLKGEVRNHNPFSGTARVLASPDSLLLVMENAEVDTLFVFDLPRPTFNEWGYIVNSGISAIETGIDSTKFDLFKGDEFFSKIEVSLNSSSGEDNPDGWVFIDTSKDYINIKTRLVVDLHVNPQKNKNN